MISIAAPDLRGELLDSRYRLDELVGFGGSGNVYAAVDLRLRREVAVKVIHPEYARDEQQRLRIRQEALIGARLAHEHLAAILDLGECAPRGEVLPFIVMPLLRGRSLRDLLNQGAVPWRAAARWVHQLLLGLAALHGEGVIHRDVKPENCLLVRERGRERLKLIDLGLAKLTRDGLLSRPPCSVAGRVVGTYAYLAPEQALGGAVDPRTDVYAAGVVLFELLTRQQPFTGTEYEVLHGHVEVPPRRPSVVAPGAGIPVALDGLVLRALAKPRSDRFASASDFDSALVSLLQEHGVDVDRSDALAGCGEAQGSLEAWSNFEHERALAQAERAMRLDPGWSPLAMLLEIARAAAG